MTQDEPRTSMTAASESAARDALPPLVELIEQYHRGVYRYAYRLSGSDADAEDLTQQTFLQVQRHVEQVRESSRLKSWIFSIVRNCFLESRRRRTPLNATTVELHMDEIVQPAPAEPVDGQQLHLALQELPDEFRMVVLMYYFEELSYREIAETLGIPIGTVMSRLSRGKSHLRARLSSDAGSAPTTQPDAVSKPHAVANRFDTSTSAGIIHG